MEERSAGGGLVAGAGLPDPRDGRRLQPLAPRLLGVEVEDARARSRDADLADGEANRGHDAYLFVRGRRKKSVLGGRDVDVAGLVQTRAAASSNRYARRPHQAAGDFVAFK